MRIRLEEITQETRYHSFILVQTEHKQIAEKWEYFILSSNGQLLMATQQHKGKYEYNFSIEAANYCINGKNFILSESNWLKPCLTSEQLTSLQNSKKMTKFDRLQIEQGIKFFYYLGQSNYGDKFIPIKPLYISSQDCLIFQSQRLVNQILLFKQIDPDYEIPMKNMLEALQSKNIFSFRSEYALLSDLHFLNCFVRSRKNIGSYIRNQQNQQYQLWIHPQILRILKNLSPYPRL